DFEREYDLPKSIEAPVKEGQRIGSVTLSYKGSELVKMDLVASETVDRSELLTAFDGIKNVITSKWFIISLLTIIGIIIIYIVSFKIYRRKKKTRRPVKKYRKF
ncbi:MAG: D-alanyl-D-alanine carboxypeptidase, partial [Clostridia bacterium]|nr:D-alanyl-D-alanine carboxypeptidase [Clostridia bacterium]